MPSHPKIAKLDAHERVALRDLESSIKSARQRVAVIVHAAARDRKLVVSGRNREKLYNQIGAVYLQLDNGLKDWSKDLIKKGAIDWHDEAIKDIKGQTGTDPSNEITRFSREYAEDVFKRVTPENGRSLAAVVTDRMAQEDIKSLRAATADVYRQASLSGMTLNQIHAGIQEKWDAIAGDQAAFRFKDSAGREWANSRYLNMLVRTTTARVARDSYFDTLTQNGDDLAVVQNVDGEACEICQAWDGVIISISGASDKYPSYQQALDAGCFHPNCRCMAERVDETIDKDAIKTQAETDTPDFTRKDDETDTEYRNRMTQDVASYSEGFDAAKDDEPAPEPVKKETDPLPKQINPVETFIETIREKLVKQPVEKFIVLNPDGKKRFKVYTSGVAGGKIPKPWIGKLDGAAFVHNHPSGIKPENKGFGTSLSPQDVMAASSQNMASMRAISARREYIMEPGPQGWPTKDRIVFEYNKADGHVRKKLFKRLNDGKIKNWQANQVHLHKVWKIVSKNLDMRYSLVRRK